MRISHALNAVCLWLVVTVCSTNVIAASITNGGLQTHGSVVSSGEGLGFTTFDVAFNSNGSITVDFDDIYGISSVAVSIGSLDNLTGTAWSSLEFQLVNSVLDSVDTIFPNTGSISTILFDGGPLFVSGGTTHVEFVLDPAETSGFTNGMAGFGITPGSTFSLVITPTAVPVPAAVWLFSSGLLGLIGISRRKKSA